MFQYYIIYLSWYQYKDGPIRGIRMTYLENFLKGTVKVRSEKLEVNVFDRRKGGRKVCFLSWGSEHDSGGPIRGDYNGKQCLLETDA